jgi:hypothetical protein
MADVDVGYWSGPEGHKEMSSISADSDQKRPRI